MGSWEETFPHPPPRSHTLGSRQKGGGRGEGTFPTLIRVTESSSEEDEEVSAREEEAVTETDSELEKAPAPMIVQQMREGRGKSVGKPKPALSN